MPDTCGKVCLGVAAAVCCVVAVAIGSTGAWQMKVANDEDSWDETTCTVVSASPPGDACTFNCDCSTGEAGGRCTCDGYVYRYTVSSLKCALGSRKYAEGSVCRASAMATLQQFDCWVNDACTEFDFFGPDVHRAVAASLLGLAAGAALCATVCICASCQSHSHHTDTIVYTHTATQEHVPFGGAAYPGYAQPVAGVQPVPVQAAGPVKEGQYTPLV